MYTSAATSSGNQPPYSILIRFAPKKIRSTAKNTPVTDPAFNRLQPHRSRVTTYASNVVITIVVVTAMPYAAARFVDDSKPSTRPTVANMSSQLISGM